ALDAMTFNKEFPASKDSLDLRGQGRSYICHTSVMSHCPKKASRPVFNFREYSVFSHNGLFYPFYRSAND
ncbi:hypothetical protein K0A69_23830, partial [Salmonella enterica subsp. enterica serovar Kentucky]|nr:hypothetical protein [Salmonella enterica subsp. enterica serovar Kentucky]